MNRSKNITALMSLAGLLNSCGIFDAGGNSQSKAEFKIISTCAELDQVLATEHSSRGCPAIAEGPPSNNSHRNYLFSYPNDGEKLKLYRFVSGQTLPVLYKEYPRGRHADLGKSRFLVHERLESEFRYEVLDLSQDIPRKLREFRSNMELWPRYGFDQTGSTLTLQIGGFCPPIELRSDLLPEIKDETGSQVLSSNSCENTYSFIEPEAGYSATTLIAIDLTTMSGGISRLGTFLSHYHYFQHLSGQTIVRFGNIYYPETHASPQSYRPAAGVSQTAAIRSNAIALFQSTNLSLNHKDHLVRSGNVNSLIHEGKIFVASLPDSEPEPCGSSRPNLSKVKVENFTITPENFQLTDTIGGWSQAVEKYTILSNIGWYSCTMDDPVQAYPRLNVSDSEGRWSADLGSLVYTSSSGTTANLEIPEFDSSSYDRGNLKGSRLGWIVKDRLGESQKLRLYKSTGSSISLVFEHTLPTESPYHLLRFVPIAGDHEVWLARPVSETSPEIEVMRYPD